MATLTLTNAATERVAYLRAFMARETDRVEIAPLVPLDTGGAWVFYDHARFTVFADGTFGSWPYGPTYLYGLKFAGIARPKVVL